MLPARVARHADFIQQGNDALELIGFRGRRSAGPGRLASDIDDVGAFAQYLSNAIGRVTNVEVSAAVGKRIRRDVEYAHH